MVISWATISQSPLTATRSMARGRTRFRKNPNPLPGKRRGRYCGSGQRILIRNFSATYENSYSDHMADRDKPAGFVRAYGSGGSLSGPAYYLDPTHADSDRVFSI